VLVKELAGPGQPLQVHQIRLDLGRGRISLRRFWLELMLRWRARSRPLPRGARWWIEVFAPGEAWRCPRRTPYCQRTCSSLPEPVGVVRRAEWRFQLIRPADRWDELARGSWFGHARGPKSASMPRKGSVHHFAQRRVVALLSWPLDGKCRPGGRRGFHELLALPNIAARAAQGS